MGALKPDGDRLIFVRKSLKRLDSEILHPRDIVAIIFRIERHDFRFWKERFRPVANLSVGIERQRNQVAWHIT